MAGLCFLWSQPRLLTWGLRQDLLRMALLHGWQAVLAVSGELSQACGPGPQFLPFGPFHERLEPPHNMVAGFQERTPQSKMEVHSIFMILPCKSYSTTSAILYWSRWPQPSPQDQREETETLLLSEMTVKVTFVRTCGMRDIGLAIFGKYNLPQYYQY